MFGCFVKEIAIDLGTTNTVVNVKGKGILLRESSIVVMEKKLNKAIAVGEKAKIMLGKTPGNIIAVKPMSEGVIMNFDITLLFLRQLIQRINNGFRLISPKLVISTPKGITKVERRAVFEAALSLGGQKSLIIDEPLAAAIGAGLNVRKPEGNMIVDIGGGITEAAVISMNEIVTGKSVRVAGDKFNEAIRYHLKKVYNFEIGEITSEVIKKRIGSAFPEREENYLEVAGINLRKGLPDSITLSSGEIREVLTPYINEITDNIRETLNITPPELAADIIENGIHLTGGGALLRGINKKISYDLRLPVYIAESPMSCCALGMTKVSYPTESSF